MTSEGERQRETKSKTEKYDRKGVMTESAMGKALPKVNPRISRDLIIKILKCLNFFIGLQIILTG